MLSKVADAAGDWLYLLSRLLVGLMLAVHGLQKFGLFGGPGLEGFASFAGTGVALAVLQGLLETVAGLMVAAGLWMRVGSILGIIAMIAAVIVGHIPQGWNPLASGAEKPLLYIGALLVYFVFGSGKLSVDAAMKKE